MKYKIYNKELLKIMKELIKKYYANPKTASEFRAEVKRVLLQHNLDIDFDIAHQCTGKNFVELHKERFIGYGKSKRRDDDVYIIYGTDSQNLSVRSNQKDPESQYRTKQKDTMEEW